MFDFQPHLVGERLELRPLRAEDYDALAAAASDPAIWEQHPQPDRYRPEVFRPYFDYLLESGGALLVLERSSGAVVGTSRYANLDAGRSEVEIGWTFLVRSLWGGEANAELKRLMLAHAFRYVETVLFAVGAGNLRSRHAVEKVGGVLVREDDDHAGGPHVVYELQRGAFPFEA